MMASSRWPFEPLGMVLVQDQAYVSELEPRPYPKLSVKLYGKGVVLDQPADGASVLMKRHQIARAGQVIVSEIWAKKGAVGIVPAEGEGALVTSHFFLFDVVRERVLPEYLHILIGANHLAEQLDAEARGTTGYASIRPSRFLRCTIPLPPLDEQRRIVAHVDGQAARIALLRSEHNARVAALNALDGSAARRLMDAVGGQSVFVGDMLIGAGLQNGRSVKSWGAPSDVMCLTLNAIRRGQLDPSQSKPVPLTHDEASNYLVSPGDVFVVRGNGSRKLVGQAGRMHDDAVGLIFPDLFIRLTLDSTRIDPDYFVLAWNAPGNRSVIEDTARTTSGIWKISQRDIARIALAVPPLPAQGDLVRRLERISVRTLEARSLAESLSSQLNAVMPGILRRTLQDEGHLLSASTGL